MRGEALCTKQDSPDVSVYVLISKTGKELHGIKSILKKKKVKTPTILWYLPGMMTLYSGEMFAQWGGGWGGDFTPGEFESEIGYHGNVPW